MIQVRQLPLGPLQTNCYLLGCEETLEAAVVDPQWEIAPYLDIAARRGLRITHIIEFKRLYNRNNHFHDLVPRRLSLHFTVHDYMP